MYFVFVISLISILIISSNCTIDTFAAGGKGKDTLEEVKYARRLKDKKSKGEKKGKQGKQTQYFYSLPSANAAVVIKGSKKSSANVYIVDNVNTFVTGGKGGIKGKGKASKQKSYQEKATSSKRGGSYGKRCLTANMNPLSPSPPSAPSPVAPKPPTNIAPSPPTASVVYGTIAICKVRQNGYFAGFSVLMNVWGLGMNCSDATVASASSKKCAAQILNANTCLNINDAVGPHVNSGFYLESSVITYTTFGGSSSNYPRYMWNGYRLRDNRNYAIVMYDSNSQPIACGTLDWTWFY